MEKLSLFDPSMQLLRKTLDLRSENQRVIASNIANADTPGYAPARFEFEKQLEAAVKRKGVAAATHPDHFPIGGAGNIGSVSGTITRRHDKTGIGDENGVNMDQEMMALSKNELLYETAAQLLKKKLTQLSYVVQGGQ